MSLADELLADLEEEGISDEVQQALPTIEEMEEDITPAKGDDVQAPSSSTTRLYGSTRLENIVQSINEFSRKPRKQVNGPVELDPEYQIIVEANSITVEIDNEIGIIHKHVKDDYLPRFPELDSLVQQPLDFVKTVKVLGNDILENSKRSDELQDFLTPATIMVISVSASTTAGTRLSDDVMKSVNEACNVATELNGIKQKILSYVQSRMTFIAPNLTLIVGASIAAKLMGAAGGLTNLAKMPACNLLVVGAQKKHMAGFSQVNVLPHTGFLWHCDVVQSTPPDLRRKASRLVAAKAALAARVDSSHESTDGKVGADLLADIEGKLEKLQEPPPVKSVKALPAPIEVSKKRRGGRRARKMKERLGMTDMHKAANRITFAEIEDEAYQEDLGFSIGTLGKKQTGKLRAPVVDSKTKAKVSKTLQQKLGKHNQWGGSTTVRKQISGTASVAFTPMQGLEIVNPLAAEQKLQDINEKYFSSTAGFMSVKK